MMAVLFLDVCHQLLDIVHVCIHLEAWSVQLQVVLSDQDGISRTCRGDCAKHDADFWAKLVVEAVVIHSGS